MNTSIEELTGLNQAFGPVAANACRISLKGDIAVRTDKGYRAYDTATRKLVNVTDFCIDLGNLFYLMPTRKLKAADIVLFDGRFKCVVEAGENTIKALDYGTSVIEEIVPESRVFFGKTFYGKIVSLAGNLKKGGNQLIKLSMISKAMGGNADTASLLPLMMLSGNSAGEDEGESMMKTMMLAKIVSGQGTDGNSLLPLLMMGKGFDGDDDLGGIGKMLMMTQLLGGQAGGGMDISKLLMFKMLGNGGADSLFGGFDLFGDDTTSGDAEAAQQ